MSDTDDKKAKRAAYAREYYAKNKDKMKAAAKRRAAKKDQTPAEQVVERGTEVRAGEKEVLNAAATVMGEMYKAGDQKMVDKTVKMFKKQIGLNVTPDLDAGHATLEFERASKKIRLPKNYVKQARLPDLDEIDEPVIPLDPAVVDELQEGRTYDEVKAMTSQEDDEDDRGRTDFDDDEDEDDEDDVFAQNERDARGREEFFREFEEQGVYEDTY